ncbi:fatty acid cis/trans isomerase [Nitrosococcus watsonii]|uniref:Fatty acid cistrans isomerase n=1 Tax=Nitrosococcus watsoni (strain C-113) TaxID=105559 RepID=D8K5W9_NITWC|nr:fatty acid cis/trans isomerase [Nitrosococcus watsonii]ADJ28296.1 fatty acid cistrans isomerase [Nitrosococcus watsonii C-113]
MNNAIPWKITLLLAASVAIIGCSVYWNTRLEQRYGQPEPRRRIVVADSQAGLFYRRRVKPVLEQRCVVCHGCYDAPCQLKLSSPAGIDRGASKEQIYNGTRLKAALPSRLYEDEKTTSGWRQRSFYPVLNERRQLASINLEASLLYQMLALKRQHPLPADPILDDTFDLRLGREQQCPQLDEWEHFSANYPLWGMPYATPGLSEAEFTLLETWLRQGAKMANEPPLDKAHAEQIAIWETFLNGHTKKQRLMARYLYEHWFLAHLYFDKLQEGEYFRLVRSRTPPGQPVERIATRRPYDDPGGARVYYRLVREGGTILAKTHMPYALNQKRMEWLQGLFLDAKYKVNSLPDYQPEVAANPFIAFEAIPVNSRWRFLLEEARFTIMNFIKGPVCRGQVALNVINDHFWVFFVAPDYKRNAQAGHFLAAQKEHLRIPVETGSNALPVSTWVKYAKAHEKYLEAKARWIGSHFGNDPLSLELVWDGGGDNQNAALTIFRHFDSASVVSGMIGREPKTAWIIDYSLLERIHYLLVAGFDVYGSLGHQLSTRLYMDFLRMEGEYNFLALLPKDTREEVYTQWYQDASKSTRAYLFGKRVSLQVDSGIKFKTDDPKSELLGMIRARLAPVLNDKYDLDKSDVPPFQWQPLKRLDATMGIAVSYLPQVVFLKVTGNKGTYYYTVLHNNAHSNITSLFREDKYRLPEKDSITVVRGFIGAYPDAFWEVDETRLAELVNGVASLQNDADYSSLVDRFGVRRTDRRFWNIGDEFTAAYKTIDPIHAGLFDYNRLENR